MTEITIISSDNKEFLIPIAVANMSEKIKQLIEGTSVGNCIHIVDVDGKILEKVIEYCQYHVDHPIAEITNGEAEVDRKTLKKVSDYSMTNGEAHLWRRNFINSNKGITVDLIQALYDLEINLLIDKTVKALTDYIRNPTFTQEQENFIFNQMYPSASNHDNEVKQHLTFFDI